MDPDSSSVADPDDCFPDPLYKKLFILNSEVFLLSKTFYSEFVLLKYRLFCFIHIFCFLFTICWLFFQNVNLLKNRYLFNYQIYFLFYDIFYRIWIRPKRFGSATQDSRIFSSSFFLGFKVLYLATFAASRGYENKLLV